jgi:hypothetical protein
MVFHERYLGKGGLVSWITVPKMGEKGMNCLLLSIYSNSSFSGVSGLWENLSFVENVIGLFLNFEI